MKRCAGCGLGVGNSVDGTIRCFKYATVSNANDDKENCLYYIDITTNPICPVCCREGEKVSGITVKSMLMNTEHYVEGNDYYICKNPRCLVAYYDAHDNTICESSLKVPIWYKEGARPEFDCYWSKVTKDDVIKAVVEKGARDVKTVSEITGAIKNSNCLVNNPTGKCCHNEIKNIIDETVKNIT